MVKECGIRGCYIYYSFEQTDLSVYSVSYTSFSLIYKKIAYFFVPYNYVFLLLGAMKQSSIAIKSVVFLLLGYTKCI